MTLAERMAKLTEKQWEVVSGLYGSPDGLAPMWFGGSNGSHHSNTARRLCMQKDPLVERRYRGGEWGGRRVWATRGSCVYRLTPLGIMLVEERKKLARRIR